MSGSNQAHHHHGQTVPVPERFSTTDCAFVLIDHQVGSVRKATLQPTLSGTTTWIGSMEVKELQKNAVILAKFAVLAKIPVVLTSSLEEMAQGLLLPGLAEALPKEYEARVKRTGIVNAWDDEAFANAVRATGKKNLVIAGATTDVCVVPPVTSALGEGFTVQVVLDACGSPTKFVDEIAIRRLEHVGARLTSVNAILSELIRTWTSELGYSTFKLIAPTP